MQEIVMRPIGVIRSPHREQAEAPMQSLMDMDSAGEIELFEEYREGARDIAPGTWGLLVFHFHKSDGKYKLVTTSHRDGCEYGVFSTRSPFRPNGIGVSTVRFVDRAGNRIRFQGVDVLDGTPLLDIKPYEPGP